jgi:hypothetical protein
MTFKTPKLAKKPSQALMQALEDLKAVERMKKTYIVDMNMYHEPTTGDDGQCSVCFAGVVIARAGNDSALSLNPEHFDRVLATSSTVWTALDPGTSSTAWRSSVSRCRGIWPVVWT